MCSNVQYLAIFITPNPHKNPQLLPHGKFQIFPSGHYEHYTNAWHYLPQLIQSEKNIIKSKHFHYVAILAHPRAWTPEFHNLVEDFVDIRTMQLVLNISQIYMGVDKWFSTI